MTAAAAQDRRLPLSEHLREARRRVIRAAVAFAVATILGYLLSGRILDVLRAPVLELAVSRDASLNYDTVTGAFDLKVRIALFAGAVLSSPMWLYQLLAYLAPALTGRERKYTFSFLFAALPLFAAGCVVGLRVFPHMVELLASFASAEDATLLSATSYVDFVLKVVLATGIGFVLPVFVVLLNFLGILSARTLARGWRIWVLGIVVFSALVTPAADVASMFLVAVPMVALFLAAWLVAVLHDRAAARRSAALLEAPVGADTPEGAV